MTTASTSIGDFVHITREGKVATVVFDRGHRTNALSCQAMRELTQAADLLDTEAGISTIVLTGRVDGFSAGADLKDPETAQRASLPLVEQRQALRLGPDMCRAWEKLEQITICAIEQFCIGGGVALAISCDIRICGEGAHLRLPEVPLGMNMSWNSNPRTVNLVGPAKAKLFTILGEPLSAAKAEQWGMVEEVVPNGHALAAALALAARFAQVPDVPLRMTKQSINMTTQALNLATSYMDRDQFALAAQSPEQAEAISSFLNSSNSNTQTK